MAAVAGMTEKQRKILDGNLTTWTKELDISGVLIFLREQNIFQERHIDEINSFRTKSDKAYELIKSLKTRGDLAYGAFYHALLFCEQDHLANLLKPELSTKDTQEKTKTQNGHPQVPPGRGGAREDKKPPAPLAPPAYELLEPPSYEAIMKNEAFYKGYQIEKVLSTLGELKDLKVECVDSVPETFNDSDIYRNFSNPKGLALIFNNRKFATGLDLPERIGTDVDAANIHRLLTQLGYQTKIKQNLSANDMASAMGRFALKSEHKACDSTVVVVLSHGTKGAFYGTDGKTIDVDRFVSCLNAENCKSLRGKPKMFFIQACRGEQYDPGDMPDSKMEIDGENAESEEMRAFEILRKLVDLDMTDAQEMKKKIPKDADIFIAYATTPGFVSWRNSLRGSWFIQAICQVFAAQAATEDLLSLMTKVNQKVAHSFESSTGHKQIPEPCSRLTKKFFFFPGGHT